MKRKFILFTLLIFSFSLLYAGLGPDFHKKGHKNFHGKRMMEEDGEFHLLFVKAKEFSDLYNFKLVFSQPLNPTTIVKENFLLNGKEIPLEKIRFSKNYGMIDFLVSAEAFELSEENNELIIKDIEAIGGNKMNPVVIENFQQGKEYRLIGKLENNSEY